MEEEIITPEEVFDYHKLRYILDKDGYVCHASMGGLVVCDLGECTEYNGDIPEGYETIEEWYDEENERLNAWKIVGVNLVFDENKYNELQLRCEIEQEENAPATHKWVNDKVRVSSSVVTDELAAETTGTSLIVIDDAGNYEIPEFKIESTTATSVNVVSSNKNILGIDAITNTINGVEITVNTDGTIKLNGTATDNIEFNLNGSSTNQKMLYLIKNNTNYAISGLTDNVSLSLYSFDGTDRTLVETCTDGIINIAETYPITETILNIPTGATFKNVVISPQIELGEATSFIKHEETKATGMLENSECIIEGLASYIDKTIIMIDEEVTSNIKYYKYQYLNEKFAEIEVSEEEIKSTVSEMDNKIDGQNQKISEVTQRVGELNSKISEIAGTTTSAETLNGSLIIEGINTSEPIYIKVHPTGTNISYLHPRNNLFPSDDLFMPARTLRFTNTTTNEYVDYELPANLLYYDAENYDEFVLDYEMGTCTVNNRVGYNADGTTRILETPTILNFDYPKIELQDGDYKISLLGYEEAYIFARLMVQNIYTTQFATKAEMNSNIKQTAQEIDLSVDKKLSNYSTTTEMNAAINVKADDITSSVSKTYSTKTETATAKTEAINSANTSTDNKLKNYSTTAQMNSAINQKADSITSSVSATYATKTQLTTAQTQIKQTTDAISTEVSKKVGENEVISKINQSSEAVQINANKISLGGKELDLTGDNITIKSTNFSLDKNGNMTCNNGKFTGGQIALKGGDEYNTKFKVSAESGEDYVSITPDHVFITTDGGGGIAINNTSDNAAPCVNLYIDEQGGKLFLGGSTVNDIELMAGEIPQIICYGEIWATGHYYLSKESLKKNIRKYKDSAIEIIKSGEIYEYNYKNEADTDKKHIGFVIGDEGGNYKTPNAVIPKSEKGIDSYSMEGILWKAIQEQQEIIEKLEKRVQELEASK